MNLQDLTDATRQMLDDVAEPYLWSDDVLHRFANNAVREVCIRARLLRDDAVSSPAICRVTVPVTAKGRFKLDPSVIALRAATLDDGHYKLWAVSSHDMDRREPGWDGGLAESGRPLFIVMDLEQKAVQLYPIPAGDVMVNLRVWRVPTPDEQMSDEDGHGEPAVEIPDAEELKHWIAHEAYLIRDEDANNPDLSARHLAIFEERFGRRPSFHDMARWADSPPRRRSSTTF